MRKRVRKYRYRNEPIPYKNRHLRAIYKQVIPVWRLTYEMISKITERLFCKKMADQIALAPGGYLKKLIERPNPWRVN